MGRPATLPLKLLKLLKHHKPRTVCQTVLGPTAWVPSPPRNPRRGFRPAPGTHGVGSGHLPEPTAWVPAHTEPTAWVLASSRNPRRGFRPAPGTHGVGSGAHGTHAVGSQNPRCFWSFIFRGCAGIRSSVFGVLRVSDSLRFPSFSDFHSSERGLTAFRTHVQALVISDVRQCGCLDYDEFKLCLKSVGIILGDSDCQVLQ